MPAAIIPAAIGAIGSIAGGAIGKQGAQSASSAQTAAAQQATAAQLGIYQANSQNLSPYIQNGAVAQDTLMRAIPTLIKPFEPTMAQLQQTPGYQFALQQGELATQNGMASQGLGQSGAALKGAANYAEGLASTTENQQFQNYMQQNSQIYNMLAGPGQSGEQAALGLAGVGTQTGQQIGNNIVGAGNAQGGAAIAGANALGGGISGAANSYLQAAMMSQMNPYGSYGSGGFGGTNDLFGGNTGAIGGNLPL